MTPLLNRPAVAIRSAVKFRFAGNYFADSDYISPSVIGAGRNFIQAFEWGMISDTSGANAMLVHFEATSKSNE